MADFFTADEHYFHQSIIEYCARGVKDVNQMHKNLIYRHNQVVKDGDT